jgi:tight adherence protein B
MSPILGVVIFAVLFAIVMVAVSIGYRVVEAQRKKQVETLLTTVSGTQTSPDEPAILREKNASDPLAGLMIDGVIIHKLQRRIQQSGLKWTVTRLFLSTVVAGAIGMAVGGLLRPLGSAPIGMIVAGLLLAPIPYLYLAFKRSRRLAEIESQLPEALDFLARSMRAGHAFSISLEMLGEESPDPLGPEFRVLFNEHNLGAPLDTCLSNLYERIPLLDVRLFVSAVMLQRITGGNLSEILLRLAHVIRERFRLRGQVKAASAHGRLTAAVLSILPIVLMVALTIVAPTYLRGMARDTDGQWMIAGAIVAQIAGYLVMRKIVNIKV